MPDMDAKIGNKTLSQAQSVGQNYSKGADSPGALVLDYVSLRLDQNEIVGLLGRSGCGKSSLLHHSNDGPSGLQPCDTYSVLSFARSK